MKDFERILVIATRQIGDVLLTTPLIHAARQRWPAAQIDVLGFAGTLGMLRGNADISELLEVAPGGGWRGALSWIRRLWRRYDLALVTQHSDRAHLYGFIAARLRSGLLPQQKSHAWWKRRLLTHAVTSADDLGAVHTVSEKLALLTPWSRGNVSTRLVPPSDTPLPTALLAQLDARPVVVHVPSMWRYKQWPLTNFRALVVALLADGRQVLLTGGPSDADRAQVSEVADLATAPRLINVAGQLDFNQLAKLLRRAALYIGPDTSVTHLAAACGVPVIALFGPSNPMRWGPWPGDDAAPTATPYQRQSPRQVASRVVLLQGEMNCAPSVPCGRAGCEDHRASRSDCLELGLAPERVIAEARRCLNGAAPSVTAPA